MIGGGIDPIGHSGGSEIILVGALSSLEDVLDYLERRIQVCFAGALAESLKDDGMIDIAYAEKELLSGGATQDLKVASDLRWLLRNIVHPEILSPEEATKQVQTLSDVLWERTIDLVQKHCVLIKGLAKNVADRAEYLDELVTISGKEIDGIPKRKHCHNLTCKN